MRELVTCLPNLQITQQKSLLLEVIKRNKRKFDSKRFQLPTSMQEDVPLCEFWILKTRSLQFERSVGDKPDPEYASQKMNTDSSFSTRNTTNSDAVTDQAQCRLQNTVYLFI